jgi:hypothetical protein
MPSTPDIDARYDDLAALVRATRPRPSAELRERVRALSAAGPAPARRLAFSFRAAAIVLASVALVGAVAWLGGGALRDGSSAGEREGSKRLETLTAGSDEASSAEPDALESSRAGTARATAPAPSRTRLQDYRADLRVRVDDLDDLSAATARAMRTARSLGGYIVSAEYERPGGGEGDSYLVVRVPVTKVQQAILDYSQLGTIVAQSIQITDLQQQVNRQTESIQALRSTVAELEASLRDPTLTEEARDRLELRLADAKVSLARALDAREATVRRGRLARIALTLTTREAAAPAPAEPGYVQRTLEDAWSALGKVVAWALFVLIVASPFLLLALLAVPLERQRRRRAVERLLERA